MRLRLSLYRTLGVYTALACTLLAATVWGSIEPGDSRLVEAVKAANIVKAKAAIAQGGAVNQRLVDGSVLLAWAVESQNPNLVKLLLSAGAKPDFGLAADAARPNFSPLIVACQRGDADIILQLLDAGADVNRTTTSGLTPLALCSGHGNQTVLQRLIALGATIEAVDENGQSALMWAAANGQTEAMALLMNDKADINRTTNKGFTPLFFAIKSGNASAPMALLDAGADASIIGPESTSAVQLAMYQQQYDFAKVLIERGVDLSAYDRNGNQLLHAAIRQRQPQLVKLLLAKGAKPNAPTGESRVVWRYEVNFTSAPYIVHAKSPLLLAAQEGSTEMMQALVKAGADTRFVAGDGTNVVLAAAQSNPEALAYALSLWPDANITNQRGQTPLHLLLSVSSSSVITNTQMLAMFKLLAAKGARIEVADTRGETPVEIGTRDQFRAKAEFAAIFKPNNEVKL